MILIVDNYDSFTYNLVQLITSFRKDIRIVRNDRCSVAAIEASHPDRILISPGPGRPESAGICVEMITRLGPRIPILGVCLGHQAIGSAFGASVINAHTLMHGKVSSIHHNHTPLFRLISDPFVAGRYHSLILSQENFPRELEITSWTDDNAIMGVRHRLYPVEGIQFHPESILTPEGPRIIENWLTSTRG